MAENKIHGCPPQLDLQQILQEVHTRWLRASEICHILRNYQKFYVKPEPPCRPPGGSLFLFDRKALRYFRKDGHRWRKKKDGKTVREAHEKLKSGSKDVLHCYYAHGEDNENFQRRSYWLLDPELDHIVLVHYREVEGNRPGASHSLNTDPVITNYFDDPRTNSATCSIPVQSSGRGTQASSPSTIDWNGHVPSSEFEDGDSGDDYGASSVAQAVSSSRIQISSHENGPAEGIFQGYRGIVPFPSSSGLMNSTVIGNVSFSPLYVNQAVPSNIKLSTDQTINHRASQEGSVHGASYSTVANATLSSSSDILSLNGKTSCSDPMTRRLISSMLDGNSAVKDGTDVGYKVQPNASQPTVARDVQISAQEHPKEDGDKCTQQFPGKRVIDDARHIYQVPHDLPFHATPQYQMNDGFSIPSNDHSVEVETNCRPVKDAPEGGLNQHEGLKKLDSFGRWMDKEIGGDCDDSLMPSDSGSYWNTLDTHPEKQEVPSLSHRMQLDIDSLCPSLAQEQLFSIRDFSPDWGYSGVETKVLISGVFLSDMNHPSSMKWCCMFGELEVPAEVLTAYALRCQAPSHATGRVPFYITCGNRLACSEVREFEYRENSSNSNLSEKTEAEEEVHFQVRFSKMLFHGRDGSRPSCTIEKCNKCSLQNNIRRMQTDHENEWRKIENIIRASEVNRKDPRDILIENFSKPKLCEWLICKIHEEGKGPNVLDEEGQGVIHLAAALGYEWAMYLIVAAGVNPSFRDARGRTGLHWAACFGREETVASLIRLGAPPDAVEDPTSKFPEGQTAADLASSRGHKGIAGYLAEAHLTSQLLSLTLQESVMGSVSATLAAEKAIESVQMERLVSLNGDGRDMISLRRSLDAVRNSAQAAARIQTAFRVQSFRLRQLTKSNDENSEIEMLVGSLNKTEKMGDFNDHLHGAAVKIQRKYRGWKGRKDYLKMRNRVVKIQAHVRGYRVRKQYRKLVWSVGILEKVILRWRRKRSGLRGFTAVKAGGTIEPGIGKIDEYDFLRQGRKQKEAGVEKALARVHSMARYQESRDQYMRLVTQFQKFKIKDKENATTEDQNQEEKRTREDILSPMID